MTQSGESNNRTLVEIQLLDLSGALVADGRFVLELQDGIGRLVEPLRSFGHPMSGYRMDLRLSELLTRSERDELEELRRLVRVSNLDKGNTDG